MHPNPPPNRPLRYACKCTSNRRWWILTFSMCTSRGFGNSMLPHTRKGPKNDHAISCWSIWWLLCWSWSHRCLVADIAFDVTIKLLSPAGNGNHTNMQHPAQITKHLQCKKLCASLRMDRCCANHVFVLFPYDVLTFLHCNNSPPEKKQKMWSPCSVVSTFPKHVKKTTDPTNSEKYKSERKSEGKQRQKVKEVKGVKNKRSRTSDKWKV